MATRPSTISRQRHEAEMGAWGNRNFENDDALDLVSEVLSGGGLDLLNDVLDRASETSYMDEYEASRALAAAEFVAASMGKASPDIPDQAKVWLTSQDHRFNPNQARQAVVMILATSELLELWKESGSYLGWRSVVKGLLKRLGGELPPGERKSHKPKSPRPVTKHPGVPPLDNVTRRILLKCNRLADDISWPLSSEERAHLEDAGLLPDSRRMTHDQVVAWACQAVKDANMANITNAFLASLTSHRLELRSALGSYAVGRHLSPHRFFNINALACDICGIYGSGLKYSWLPIHAARFVSVLRAAHHKDTYDLAKLSYARYTGGGIYESERTEYIAFDLTEFSKLPPCQPTGEDIQVFREILKTAESMPANANAKVLISKLRERAFFCANEEEYIGLLSTLGYCGILQSSEHPAFSREYVPRLYRDKALGYNNKYLTYPICTWRGSDGVNRNAVAHLFPLLPL